MRDLEQQRNVTQNRCRQNRICRNSEEPGKEAYVHAFAYADSVDGNGEHGDGDGDGRKYGYDIQTDIDPDCLQECKMHDDGQYLQPNGIDNGKHKGFFVGTVNAEGVL